MNSIIKMFMLTGLLAGFGAIISVLIPNQFTGTINDTVVYFISQLYYLDNLFPVTVMLRCAQILITFYSGLSGFIFIRWWVHLFSA